MYVHVSGLLSLLLLASAWQGTSGQPCEKGTMYQKGKCITCDRCYAGSELNYTNFDKGLEMGYLSCPPCSPCSEGSYQEPNSIFNTCKKCRKNCTAENKIWETRCGDTSPGDCGNCMDGYVQNSSDSNSPCIKRTLIEKDNIAVWIIVVVVVVVIVVITGAVSFCFVRRGESGQRCYKGRPTVTDGLDEAEAGKSSEAIIKETYDRGQDKDVDIDGLTELSETSPLVGTQVAMPVPDSRQYPVYIITSDEGLGKEILKHIAKKIYDEQVMEFFRYLGVGDEDIYPQEYIDFKYNILLTWIEKKGNQATLDVLCDALCKANFHTVLNDVLTKYKENSED